MNVVPTEERLKKDSQAKKLNRLLIQERGQQLPVTTLGSLADAPEKIIQFGEGNFLRAFVQWHFHEMERRGLFVGKAVVVQPLETGMVNQLNEQQCAYTLIRRGLRSGTPVEESDVITNISRGLNPFTQFEEFLRCAENPAMRYLISNTTEAGIEYHPVPKPEGKCPKSFPAKVTLFLYERFHTFNGAPDKGMVIIPCELINNNGYTLRQCILHHTIDWNLETEFIDWVKMHNIFCDTLVDRIVPGYPKEEAEVLATKLGYNDSMMVASELFHLWVLKPGKDISQELPFKEAGLNVVWTDDISPYRTLKVRILNGVHTMFCITAFLAGVDTVRESLDDPLVNKFIMKGLYQEILPSMNVPEETKQEYAGIVLERFKNPFIKHLLQSINMNSVSKFRVRVLPSLLGFVEKKKTVPEVLSFSIAALIVYYKTKRESSRASVGVRNGAAYVVNDDQHVLEFFAQRSGCYENELERLCKDVLGNITFWDRDLTQVNGLLPAVVQHVEGIQQKGIRSAIQQVI